MTIDTVFKFVPIANEKFTVSRCNNWCKTMCALGDFDPQQVIFRKPLSDEAKGFAERIISYHATRMNFSLVMISVYSLAIALFTRSLRYGMVSWLILATINRMQTLVNDDTNVRRARQFLHERSQMIEQTKTDLQSESIFSEIQLPTGMTYKMSVPCPINNFEPR